MKLKYFPFVPLFALLFLALAAALVSGCARPPVAEMDSAQEAVVRAENDADAALYAGNSIARARDALSRMQAEADSKRYDAAKSYAAEAEAAANKAIADGRSGAVRAREEAAALVAGLAPAITEAEQGLRAARSAGLALDYTDLNSGLDTARYDAGAAQAALSGNQYQDALGKGRSAQAGLSDINQKLSTAATASSRKK